MPDIYQDKKRHDDAMEIFSLLRSNIGLDEALTIEGKEIQELILQCVNEVYSSTQRRWACAQAGDSRKDFKGEPSLSAAEAEEMCTGPMKKAKKEVRIVRRKLKEISGMAIGSAVGHSGRTPKKVRRRRKNA